MAYPHEVQAHTSGQHTYDREKGYQPAEYKFQEYPKIVNGVTFKSAEDEAAFKAKQEEPKAEVSAAAAEPAKAEVEANKVEETKAE